MPFRINPTTGTLDRVDDPGFPVTTGAVPTTQTDGYITVVDEGGTGKIYFFSNGNRFSLTGTAEP